MSLLKKAATALILISIFSFTSCVNVDYSLGSGFVPSDQNLQIFSDTIDLPVGLKMTDSLQASSYYLAVGNCYDEIFGLTKIDLAMTVAPPTVNDTSFKFGTDPEIISADLGFNLTNVRTFDKGELHIPQNLHIYPLTIALDTTRIFCNSIDESCYDPTPINKGSAVYFGTDSITIPLKNEWAAKFLTATDADMDSLLLYIEKFHGVYVTADDPINLDQYAGRINNFGAANMSITYKFTNSEGVRKDTTAIFPVGSGSYGFSVQRYRHESENLEMPSNNNSDILYYQGLAGIKPYIDGQELLELMHRWADKKGIDLKSLIIARASFDFPFEFPEDYTLLDTYPAGLFPCVRSLASDSLYHYNLLSTIYSDSYSKGDIDRNLCHYRPDVTEYLQVLVGREKAIPEDNIWMIAPFEYVVSSGSSSSYSDYYNYYNMYNMYNMYNPYSYGYGYSSYYGYNSMYNMYNMYNYYNSASSSSSQTYYYADYINYNVGAINGNGAERHPRIIITYSTLK